MKEDNIVTVIVEGEWSDEWTKHLDYLHREYGGRWIHVVPSFAKDYAENKEGRQFYLDRTERLYG